MDFLELIKKEGLRRGLSRKTIKTYCFCVKKFFSFHKKDPRKIKKQDIKDYLDRLVENGLSGSTINVNLNALKFLFQEIMQRRFLFYFRFSKIPKRLPVVLTKEEVSRLFKAITNEKHSLMIRLMYSAGLRVNELVNLRVNDFEFNLNYGFVRQGKGRKDRLFIISKNIKDELLGYIRKNNISYNDFLFSGRNGHVSTATIREIIKKAAKKAKIEKNIHPHTLRHSFATHLIEDGYSVNTLQSLLGHSSLETTMVYIHISSPKMINVISPYDTLNIESKRKD